MARLNEPVAPTESIESIKRKFMRQNRDIARANSTQSLRIRNLENETSRLLAENLELREQILRVKNELDHSKTQFIAKTRLAKSHLQTKLLELGALVNSLGDEPTPEKSPGVGRIVKASPSRSLDRRNWKNMCSLSEAVAGQEGRLPPILENQTYPRRTLQKQEILTIMSDDAIDSTDSPEIGPPPVSQFVEEDPVKIDVAIRPHNPDNEEIPGLNPALSANLEQRKKRKDSVGGPESKRVVRIEAKNGRESTGSLKTGAKRKLGVREDDEREIGPKPVHESLDDFNFTRVAAEDKSRNRLSQYEKHPNKTTRELATARGVSREKQPPPTANVPSTRKVLAPKSVNNSPLKGSRAIISDDHKMLKADTSKENPVRQRSKERGQESLSSKLSVEPAIESVEIQTEPETPAGLGIFSPSSQPSTARAESRDTPPPPDLGPGTEGQRPSRRARGAVSYAEPNLRDKMRRPTKELVDAVGADAKVHRTSIIKVEDDGASDAVKIKPEPGADDAWKKMPVASSSTVENSPLSGKAPVSDTLPSSITTHRRRRESILHKMEEDLPRSGSSSAIVALIAESRKSKALKAEAREKALQEKQLAAKVPTSLDIYDFKGSSPALPEESLAESTEEKPPGRISRRRSIMPHDMPFTDESAGSDIEVSKKGRRQSTLGLRSSSAIIESGKEDEETLKKATRIMAMGDLAVSGSRSDRIAARRKSMML